MHNDGCARNGTGKNGLMAKRRDVLRLALSSAGALVLSAVFRPLSAAPVTGSKVSTGDRVPITAWVRIASDGSVTLIASQSEMGQGITTTLAAALADELYLPWESVKIEFGAFDPAYRDPVYQWMFTGNSQSTSSFYETMRKMGAAAREVLTSAAATRLGVTAASLSLRQGAIWHETSRRSVLFGAVAADAARLPLPANPTPRADPQLAGRSIPRWDVSAKVDGSAIFGIDVNLPGMLCAAVRCSPRFGARLINYDRAAIQAHGRCLGNGRSSERLDGCCEDLLAGAARP
jgi:isoquinoline 1-oxidoreductase subunit beta